MQYLPVGKGPRTKQQTKQLTGSYNDVKRSLTGYRLSGGTHDRGPPARPEARGSHPNSCRCWSASTGAAVGTVDDGTLEVLFDGVFWDAVGAAEPDSRHLPRMHESVHGHLGHPHEFRDFGHGQKTGL